MGGGFIVAVVDVMLVTVPWRVVVMVSWWQSEDELVVVRWGEDNGFLVNLLKERVFNSNCKNSQLIADDMLSLFVSDEIDKVELLYTKFKSNPVRNSYNAIPLVVERDKSMGKNGVNFCKWWCLEGDIVKMDWWLCGKVEDDGNLVLFF